MVDLDLAYLSAGELAKHYRQKTLSPVDVVRNALNRIAAINPKLNAFCFVYGDEALKQAEEAERRFQRDRDQKPLLGIPIAIKDLTPTKGKRTTLGSKIFEHWIPTENAVIVDRLLNAGAIIIGKTNTSEFAHTSFTDSPLWGPTANPWDNTRTSGGSSGGSAVAVATGCVPIAEGSDAGGSVRIPAALCGIVGLKPSFGRIPVDILPTDLDALFHFGPLTRTVADAAQFLSLTQGPDDRDMMSLPCTSQFDLGEPFDVSAVKIGLCIDQDVFAVHEDVVENTLRAAELLGGLGATVEPITIGWTPDILDNFYDHWAVFHATCFGEHLSKWRSQMSPSLVDLIEHGRQLSAVKLKAIELARKRQWAALRRVFERYDVLLTPTMALPAPALGGSDMDYVSTNEHGKINGLDMTCTINMVSPCPAISLPSGFTRDRLPTAIQFVGRRYEDHKILRLAAVYERNTLWRKSRPPI